MAVGTILIKSIKWLLALAFTLPVAAYLFLLVINWSDRPPSAVAIEFQRALEKRSQISDSDNAYVYMMGFDIARDLDPVEWGRRRIDWIDSISGNPGENHYDNPPGEYTSIRKARSQLIQNLASACWQNQGAECTEALVNGEKLLDEWLAEERWVLNRYRSLVSLPAWQEIIPKDIAAPFPPYAEVLEGQRLLMLQAWKLAGDGDVAEVRALLEEDIRFWRVVLANADILITKMIATAALGRHFGWSNQVIRRLPADAVKEAIPNSWRLPLSKQELSLEATLIGEWRFAENTVAAFKADFGPDTLAAYLVGEEGPVSRFVGLLAQPLLQPQATSNTHAETLLAIGETLRVPLDELPQALEEVAEIGRGAGGRGIGLYNPVGGMLANHGYAAYASYPPRVADLEGVRRAALLAALLRSRAVALEPRPMQRLLDQSDLRNPYNGEPFAWDDKNGAIVFIGLEPGERGLHTFLY